MADLPFLVELNEQNLTETLQRSVETPLVINFYAPCLLYTSPSPRDTR